MLMAWSSETVLPEEARRRGLEDDDEDHGP